MTELKMYKCQTQTTAEQVRGQGRRIRLDRDRAVFSEEPHVTGLRIVLKSRKLRLLTRVRRGGVIRHCNKR